MVISFRFSLIVLVMCGSLLHGIVLGFAFVWLWDVTGLWFQWLPLSCVVVDLVVCGDLLWVWCL